MPQHTGPEDERRQDPSAPGASVERHPRPDGDDAHPIGDRWPLAPPPLTQSQVRDIVSLVRQPLDEAPVPALASPDRVWEKAVVDHAYAHRPLASHLADAGTPRATFRPSQGYKRHGS